jgi:hypothetical protein
VRVSSVVAYWTRIHVVMGSNSGLVNLFLFHPAIILLYIILNYYVEVVQFSKLYYRTSLYDRIASGASVGPTSHVRLSAVLVLPILGS